MVSKTNFLFIVPDAKGNDSNTNKHRATEQGGGNGGDLCVWLGEGGHIYPQKSISQHKLKLKCQGGNFMSQRKGMRYEKRAKEIRGREECGKVINGWMWRCGGESLEAREG